MEHGNESSAIPPELETLEDILARIGEHINAADGVERPPLNGDGARIMGEPVAREAETNSPMLPALATEDYIPAEVFLENMGYFTPSSKRIRGIYLKEKKVAERVEPDGSRRVIKTRIRASHGLGLPITSDLDYYRAFLKIFYETVEQSD